MPIHPDSGARGARLSPEQIPELSLLGPGTRQLVRLPIGAQRADRRRCGDLAVADLGKEILDGASGLLELKHSGGLCLAQDETSSLFFDMPKAAIEAGAVNEILDIEEITGFLLRCAES